MGKSHFNYDDINSCIQRLKNFEEKHGKLPKPPNPLEAHTLHELLIDEEYYIANTFTLPGEGHPKPSQAKTDGIGVGLNPITHQSSAFGALNGIRELITLGNEKSTIIIIDDFRFDQFKQDSGHAHQAKSGLRSWIDWVFDPAEVEFRLSLATRIANARQLTNFRKEQALYNLGVTHGSLVLLHTINLLKEFAVMPVPSALSREPNFPHHASEPISYTIPFTTPQEGAIDIIAVDTNEFNTNQIADGMRHAIDLAKQRESNRIVVNMSFGLVPRKLLENFKACQADSNNPIDSFEDYVNFFANNGETIDEEFQAELTSIILNAASRHTDAMYQLAEECMQACMCAPDKPETFFAFVASAGNYGQDFPIYPAAWKDFISVSTPASYSNTGEISAPGDVIISPSASVSGTSFAAPLVSVFSALDMTQSTPRCGYAIPSRLIEAQLDHRDWPLGHNITTPMHRVNLPLEEAIKTICDQDE